MGFPRHGVMVYEAQPDTFSNMAVITSKEQRQKEGRRGRRSGSKAEVGTAVHLMYVSLLHTQ